MIGKMGDALNKYMCTLKKNKHNDLLVKWEKQTG